MNLRELEIFCSYYDILLLNYTYNFIQFKISLFNIVVVSEISTIIQVALIFIKIKKETDYLWALIILHKAIRENSILKIVLTNHKLVFINTIDIIFLITSFFFIYIVY